VEGEGDRDAIPILVKQLITDKNGWAKMFLDPDPFVVGGIPQLTKDDGRDWLRYLHAAQKRKNLGGVLLVVDGDLESIRKEHFCPGKLACRLAEWAQKVGAGKLFSVACVVARQEYESWLVACSRELAGALLSDGRQGIESNTGPPAGDLELSPRSAKDWLDKHMKEGYKPTRDQVELTRLMINHLNVLRTRNLRSFSRIEKSIQALITAFESGNHCVTPTKASDQPK
jgi:hypothetical protein